MDIGTYNCGPYPKWKYHSSEPPRWVTNQYDDQALGEGWTNEYQKQAYPKAKWSSTGEFKAVNDPEEEGKLEGSWSDTPPPPEERSASGGHRTLDELGQDAKTKRRAALDYEQLNDEMELKADNTAMKPLKTGENPQPQYHKENTPKQPPKK